MFLFVEGGEGFSECVLVRSCCLIVEPRGLRLWNT